MFFVDARPSSATVKALEDSTVFGISKAVLSAKLAADQGFAARFYRALAIFLFTTVRERHRALDYGSEEDLEGKEDEADELDGNVLDGVYLAGGAVRPDGEAGAGELTGVAHQETGRATINAWSPAERIDISY